MSVAGSWAAKWEIVRVEAARQGEGEGEGENETYIQRRREAGSQQGTHAGCDCVLTLRYDRTPSHRLRALLMIDLIPQRQHFAHHRSPYNAVTSRVVTCTRMIVACRCQLMCVCVCVKMSGQQKSPHTGDSFERETMTHRVMTHSIASHRTVSGHHVLMSNVVCV